jgi:hypothetical protein
MDVLRGEHDLINVTIFLHWVLFARWKQGRPYCKLDIEFFGDVFLKNSFE